MNKKMVMFGMLAVMVLINAANAEEDMNVSGEVVEPTITVSPEVLAGASLIIISLVFAIANMMIRVII